MAAVEGRLRVAVLISGAGSNMAALIDASRAGDCPFEVVLVLSNKPDAGGLAVAEAKGVATAAVDHRPFGKDREAHERAVQAVLGRTLGSHSLVAGPIDWHRDA